MSYGVTCNVESDNVKSGSVEWDKSGNVDSGTVDSGTVDSGTVDSGNIKPGNVDSGNVDSGNIESSNVETGNIETDNAKSDNVDSGKVQSDNSNQTTSIAWFITMPGPMHAPTNDRVEHAWQIIRINWIALKSELVWKCTIPFDSSGLHTASPPYFRRQLYFCCVKRLKHISLGTAGPKVFAALINIA